MSSSKWWMRPYTLKRWHIRVTKLLPAAHKAIGHVIEMILSPKGNANASIWNVKPGEYHAYFILKTAHHLWDDRRGKCQSSRCPLLKACAAKKEKFSRGSSRFENERHVCSFRLFLQQLVPDSRRPAGAVTRGCEAPTPWAAWTRDSISESSTDALLSSWCQTLPPPAGHWLEWQRTRCFSPTDRARN